MKKLLGFLLLSLFLLSACAHCTTGQIRSAMVPRLSESTVSLVHRDGDGDMAAFCTGVWVSQSVILTAAHCVEGESFINYITKNVEPELFEEPSAVFAASVRIRDTDHDLALMDAYYPYEHAYARLAKMSPAVGDDIITIGSTIGLTWSVSGGNVAAYRNRLNFVTMTEGPFMELVSAAYHGNSGGPVFDMHGELVGIVVQRTPAPTVLFAIHRVSVRDFLVKNGV